MPGQRRLVAYLVPAAGADDPFPVAHVRDGLRRDLPDYMVPSAFAVLDALPLSPNGKLDRAALPEPTVGARSGDAGPVEPATPTEQRVAAAFCEVLTASEPVVVGATDDFFDLGGDSFSAVRAVRCLGGDVSVVDLFTHPTVRDLALFLDARSGGDGPSASGGLLRRLGRPSTLPAAQTVHVVCVPYGGGSPVTFAPLAAELGAGDELHAVDLPGHDTARPDETTRPLEEVAEALVAEIAALGGPVVLYGHCLGGALAVRTALALEEAGVEVLGVVAAGTFPAARLPGRIASLVHRLLPSDRLLSDRAYHEMLRSLGGFTDVVDERDRALLVRALRHDNREAEEYYTRRFTALERGEQQQRLRAPMLCVVGERDRATELYTERFAEWEDFSDDVDLAVIPRAGHYFLKHQADELASVLSSRIEAWRAGRRPRTTSATAGSGTASTRTFLVVALTQILSMIGTGLTTFALGIWVLQQTGSVAAFATISVTAVAPAILVSPIAGAVADRFDRRRVMLLSDGAAGVATLALLVLLFTGRLELAYIYAFAAIGSVANAFQRPAYLAAVAQLVPKRYLGQASGLVNIGTSSGDLIAALLGGVLIGLVGLKAVVLVDIVTFSVGIVVLLLVRFPALLFVRREEPLLKEVVTGWRYIVRRPGLVAMVVFFVVFNFLFSLPVVLTTPLVLSTSTPQVLGLVTAVGGTGAMAGALVMALWGGTRRRAHGMVGGTGLLGMAVVVLGIHPHPVVQAVGLFGVYAMLMIVNSHWLALIQSKVGLELQGRVLATNQMLAMSMMPLGFLSASAFVSGAGEALAATGPAWTAPGRDIGAVLVAAGVVLVVWTVLGLAFRPLRRMEEALPDAVPDATTSADKDELQALADARLRS